MFEQPRIPRRVIPNRARTGRPLPHASYYGLDLIPAQGLSGHYEGMGKIGKTFKKLGKIVIPVAVAVAAVYTGGAALAAYGGATAAGSAAAGWTAVTSAASYIPTAISTGAKFLMKSAAPKAEASTGGGEVYGPSPPPIAPIISPPPIAPIAPIISPSPPAEPGFWSNLASGAGRVAEQVIPTAAQAYAAQQQQRTIQLQQQASAEQAYPSYGAQASPLYSERDYPAQPSIVRQILSRQGYTEENAPDAVYEAAERRARGGKGFADESGEMIKGVPNWALIGGGAMLLLFVAKQK